VHTEPALLPAAAAAASGRRVGAESRWPQWLADSPLTGRVCDRIIPGLGPGALSLLCVCCEAGVLLLDQRDLFAAAVVWENNKDVCSLTTPSLSESKCRIGKWCFVLLVPKGESTSAPALVV